MGSIGAARNNNISTDSFVGKNVDDLFKAISKQADETYADRDARIKQMFGFENVSEKQITTLVRLLSGIKGYDVGYDEAKTPFNITNIHIEEMKSPISVEEARSLGMRVTKNPINFYVRTEPNTESAYLRMTDAKTHSAIIGANGGLYTYSSGSNGKRRKLNYFDVAYGNGR